MFEKVKELGNIVANASGMAKKITLLIVSSSFLIGVLGSMGLIPLKMDDYVKFLDNYTPTIITLLCSVGVGSIAKTGKEIVENKGKEK